MQLSTSNLSTQESQEWAFGRIFQRLESLDWTIYIIEWYTLRNFRIRLDFLENIQSGLIEARPRLRIAFGQIVRL